MWRLGDLPKLPEISAYALVTLARGLRLIRGSKYLRLRLRSHSMTRRRTVTTALSTTAAARDVGTHYSMDTAFTG